MPSDDVLPYDIAIQIIDIVGETKNTNLLKRLALVSHSFNQLCSKYLFATIELHDAKHRTPSSKKGFIKLVESRPDVIRYIHKLTYNLTRARCKKANVDHLVSPVLSNFLPTISCLNTLEIIGLDNTSYSKRQWNRLDSSLTSSFLHLMHLPTINHIHLSNIVDFPLSSLASCVNLHGLNIRSPFNWLEEECSVVQSKIAPKIREFQTELSFESMKTLLHAKRQDGQPAFDFMDLRRLSMFFARSEDYQNLRYLLQNAKLFEELHLEFGGGYSASLLGLDEILSASARTLKVLDLTVLFSSYLLVGLCEKLEAMAGHDTLEALSFEFVLEHHEREDSIGTIVQEVETLLVKPGWSALRQVSIKFSIALACGSREYRAELVETLQCLPDIYLSRLSNLESVAFNYSVVRRNTG